MTGDMSFCQIVIVTIVIVANAHAQLATQIWNGFHCVCSISFKLLVLSHLETCVQLLPLDNTYCLAVASTVCPYCEWYYPSMRMENKGFLALFSVHQGRWADLLLDQLGFSVTCTLVMVTV